MRFRFPGMVFLCAAFVTSAAGQLDGELSLASEQLQVSEPERRVAAPAASVLSYDDGEPDNGVRANFPSAIEFAMRFDAAAGTVDQLQICLQRLFASDSGTGTFDVSIYDATSSGPGALLHAFEASVTNLPVTGVGGSFRTFNLPPPPRAIPASFFVGVTMDSITSDFYLCVDEDGGARPIYASLNGGAWTNLAGVDPSIRKLMIRARVDTATTPPPPPPPPGACVDDATTACLLGNRFSATVRFRLGFDDAPADTTANRKSVTGFANPAFETELFFFGDPDNIEIVLKMLDQGNTNSLGQPTIAVLFGSATPLRTEITVTDTTTGVSKTYVSPFGSQRGSTDFTAFVK